MAKIALEIKNVKKAIKPTTNDIILFDGKNWYITTKDDLLKEFNEKVANKEKELNEKIKVLDEKTKDFERIKIENAKQIAEITKAVREFISGGLK